MKWKDEWEACPEQQWKEQRHMPRALCTGKPEPQFVPDPGASEAQMSPGNLHASPQQSSGQVREWVTGTRGCGQGSVGPGALLNSSQQCLPCSAWPLGLLAEGWAAFWPLSPTWSGLLHCISLQAWCLCCIEGACFYLFLAATWFLASRAGSYSPALLPIYLLFLAQGATREQYRLLPTLSAWEQGTRRGAQILVLPCC